MVRFPPTTANGSYILHSGAAVRESFSTKGNILPISSATVKRPLKTRRGDLRDPVGSILASP